MDFKKLTTLWIGTAVVVPYILYIALRDLMNEEDQIYHQEVVKTTLLEMTLNAECIMIKCEHRLLVVSKRELVESVLRTLRRNERCVDEMRTLYAHFLPYTGKKISVVDHWQAFLQRFFNPQFVKAVIVKTPKRDTLSDDALGVIADYVTPIRHYFCQYLIDLGIEQTSASVIDQLFVNFNLAVFSSLVRESRGHFSHLRTMHNYTCFRWFRGDDTAEHTVLHFDHPANGLELRTIALAIDVYAKHFSWDDIPSLQSSQEHIAYPSKYMWAIVAAGVGLANTTYTSSPFVSITHGVATNSTVINSSYIATLIHSEEREDKNSGLLHVLFTAFLTHCTSAFRFRTSGTPLSSQQVLKCNETELALKLWFMFRALKPRLLALMSDWRPMHWLDVEMFLNALFCVTLRTYDFDDKSRHVFSPQIKYPIVRDFQQIVVRLLGDGHKDEILLYLKSMLDSGLAKTAPLLGDGVDVSQIPVDFETNAHDVMNALFEFAYLAQIGTYVVTDDEIVIIQSIYVDYNVNVGAECSMRSALRKASPKYSVGSKKRTHAEMESEEQDQGGEVQNERFFLHRCKNTDNEYEQFSIMLRLMECHACPMCNEQRHDCVHFSFFDDSPRLTLLRNFSGCKLMGGIPGFNIGVTGINRVMYKFFDAANDMSLRQTILNSNDLMTFIDFTKFIPKLL